MQNLMKMEIWVFVLGQVNESIASICQIYIFTTKEEIFYLNIYLLRYFMFSGIWLVRKLVGMILQLLLRFELLGGGEAGKVCGCESKWIHARRKIKAKINSIPTARASWGKKGGKG